MVLNCEYSILNTPVKIPFAYSLLSFIACTEKVLKKNQEAEKLTRIIEKKIGLKDLLLCSNCVPATSIQQGFVYLLDKCSNLFHGWLLGPIYHKVIFS